MSIDKKIYQNIGLVREREFVAMFDGKKYIELSRHAQNLFAMMFKDFNHDEIIIAKQIDGFKKADVYLEIGGIRKNLSLKSGKSVFAHSENNQTFVTYLSSLGISSKSINSLLLYLYGDGTIDGSGQKRMEYQDIMVKYQKEISDANYELNCNKYNVIKTVRKCLFDDFDYHHDLGVDYIYHGDTHFGVLVSMKQIVHYLNTRSFHFYKNLHIGPLLIRPEARYVDGKTRHEHKRHQIQLYWPKMSEDLYYISQKYKREL